MPLCDIKIIVFNTCLLLNQRDGMQSLAIKGKLFSQRNTSSLQRVETLSVPFQVQPFMDPPRSFPDVASWIRLYHVPSLKTPGEQGLD